jgi:hypothetical protein
MEQIPCPVVGEVTKPTGVGVDKLDSTSETLCTGIADSVLAKVEQPFFVAPEHLDDLFDWLQLAAHRIVRPGQALKNRWAAPLDAYTKPAFMVVTRL